MLVVIKSTKTTARLHPGWRLAFDLIITCLLTAGLLLTFYDSFNYTSSRSSKAETKGFKSLFQAVWVVGVLIGLLTLGSFIIDCIETHKRRRANKEFAKMPDNDNVPLVDMGAQADVRTDSQHESVMSE